VRTANFVSVDSSANGKTRTATYEVKGPHGIWNRAHDGTYTIWVVNNQVRDTTGNFITGQKIGEFTVRIAKAVSAPIPAPANATQKKHSTSGVLA